MGAWSDGIFGNDAALDLVGDLEEAATPEGVARHLESAFTAYEDWHREAKDGVVMVTMTPEEVEEAIVRSRVPGAKLDKAALETEEIMRESWSEPFPDEGERLADQVLAASAIVVACATQDYPDKELRGAVRKVLQAYTPTGDMVRHAIAVLGLAAQNRARRKRFKRWPTLTTAVLDALRALPT